MAIGVNRGRDLSHRVPPVVVMIGGGAIPAAIVGLDRRVVPLHAGVRRAHHHALAGIAQRPHIVGVHALDVPLHRIGGWRCRFLRGRQLHTHARVGGNAAHLRPRRQLQDQVLPALHPEHIDAEEALVGDTPALQIGFDARLSALGQAGQRVIDIAALFQFGGELIGRAHVRLFRHDDEKFRRLTVRSGGQNLGVHFVAGVGLDRRRRRRRCDQQAEEHHQPRQSPEKRTLAHP